jgi:hypothetical protein
MKSEGCSRGVHPATAAATTTSYSHGCKICRSLAACLSPFGCASGAHLVAAEKWSAHSGGEGAGSTPAAADGVCSKQQLARAWQQLLVVPAAGELAG